MNKHTPGPWIADKRYYVRKFSNYGAIVARVSVEAAESVGGIQQANARLIAAAPELLEALQSMVDTFTAGESGQHGIRLKAIEIIAKATGKP